MWLSSWLSRSCLFEVLALKIFVSCLTRRMRFCSYREGMRILFINLDIVRLRRHARPSLLTTLCMLRMFGEEHLSGGVHST